MNSSKYVNLYEYLESNPKLKYIIIMKSIIEKLNISFEILKKFIINKY